MTRPSMAKNDSPSSCCLNFLLFRRRHFRMISHTYFMLIVCYLTQLFVRSTHIIFQLFCFTHVGESVSVLKHTDPIPDPRAVNQDKKNILFSVSSCRKLLLYADISLFQLGSERHCVRRGPLQQVRVAAATFCITARTQQNYFLTYLLLCWSTIV